MKRVALTILMIGTVASAAFGSPLKVVTRAKNQTVVMCPDCGEKLSCPAAGDYLLGMEVDLDSPKTGGTVLAVHVLDKEKKPVKGATVKVTLSMPAHRHRREALALRHTGHGRYESATVISMTGGYQAEVAATLPGGDTVKQTFAFTR